MQRPPLLSLWVVLATAGLAAGSGALATSVTSGDLMLYGWYNHSAVQVLHTHA
jgi:hypothetical protein